MKFPQFFFIAAIVSFSIQVNAAQIASKPDSLNDLKSFIRKIEMQYQAQTSHGVARMTIVTKKWTRELRMEMWGEGRDKFLAKILSPKKEAGISTLKVNDDIWNYLPKIDRMMKVPSSLMGEGWMGSHYTNDDLVQDAKIDELYSFSLAYYDEATATIVATPMPDAAIVWGRIDYDVNHLREIPLVVRYFDEDGILVRKMIFSKIEKISGREIPLNMKVIPIDDPGEYTEFVYESLDFGKPLKKNYFSLTTLRRR